jgi:hypothetical protein
VPITMKIFRRLMTVFRIYRCVVNFIVSNVFFYSPSDVVEPTYHLQPSRAGGIKMPSTNGLCR